MFPFILKKKLLRADALKAWRRLLQRVFSPHVPHVNNIGTRYGSSRLVPQHLPLLPSGNHYLWRSRKNSLGTSLRPPDLCLHYSFQFYLLYYILRKVIITPYRLQRPSCKGCIVYLIQFHYYLFFWPYFNFHTYFPKYDSWSYITSNLRLIVLGSKQALFPAYTDTKLLVGCNVIAF